MDNVQNKICRRIFTIIIALNDIKSHNLNKKLDIKLSIVCTNSFSCEGVGVFIGTMESTSLSPSSIEGAGRIGRT